MRMTLILVLSAAATFGIAAGDVDAADCPEGTVETTDADGNVICKKLRITAVPPSGGGHFRPDGIDLSS